MNPATLQLQLQLPYRRQSWNVLVSQVFPGQVEMFQHATQFPLTSENQRVIATDLRQIGRIVIPDGQGGQKILAVFEVDVAAKVDLLRNRVALRQLVSRCIDEISAHAVLAFFVQQGSKPYRLTYATRESALNTETLALETRETATRRFTYVLGPGEARRTAAARLSGLADKRESAMLSDVTEAFSVELLNKEFFEAYKAHYQNFCAHLIDGNAPTHVFGLKLEGLDEKARDHTLKPVRDFVKKMMGRLVFLHFLQKKGWLGCPANSTNWKNGEPNFLRQLFDTAPPADQERFHSRLLVPLFFDTLNRQRKADIFPITGTRVPYLNGGLFERDFDGVEKIDFPAKLFADLLEFFGQYNFTIDENDPDDHEIGIDPEMLGHIFENLLEDNKDKGAFYTPKGIVQYMCQQSLIYYLKSHLGDRPEIETLVRRKEPGDPADKQNWIRQNAKRMEKLLDELRICDPAIGSGAFPIGLLQEIYWIKLSLDWTLDRAETKRDIIQRSIYGVDLDAGAVEIARLRFWLALIVEEDTPRPLPNLDYRIMQGDSLRESFEGIDLSNLTGKKRHGVQLLGTEQTEFGLKAVSTELTVEFAEGKQAEITRLISGYFDKTDPEQKQRLHRQIDELVLGHIEYNLDLHEERMHAALDNACKELNRKQAVVSGYQPTKKEGSRIAELEAQLVEVDRKRVALAGLQAKPERPFFLWHLYFQDVFAHSGFDIVIGNPPFVDSERMTNEMPEYREILASSYSFAKGNWDLYVPFWELALKLRAPKGIASLLTPNKWLSIAYGKALRKNIGPRVAAFADFSKFRAFEEVGVFPVVAFAADEPLEAIQCSIFGEGAILVSDFALPRSLLMSFDNFGLALSRHAWLVKKLTDLGSPLEQLAEVEEAFTVSEAYELKKIIFDADAADRNALRLVTTGSVEPFHTLWGVELTTYLKHRYFRPSVSISDFRRQFPRRADRAESPKIILSGIRHFEAFLDERGEYLPSKSTVVVREFKRSSKALTAFLNSSVARFFLKESYGSLAMDGGINFSPANVGKIPIPQMFSADEKALAALAERAAAAALVDITPVLSEVDEIVFRLFQLSPDEISVVKSSVAACAPGAAAKSVLFSRLLSQLKEASAYFTTATIVRRVKELGLAISEGTLQVYLTEATANGLIHDAGRGWYSRLREPVPLDQKPVAKLIRAVEKAFPLLQFTVWSTAQINPWMHHLLAQPVAFLYAQADTLESVGDTLRAQGWEVAIDPGKKEGPKVVRPGEKMVVLRPTHSKQPPPAGRQAKIEQILVDLQIEAGRLALMDISEAQAVTGAILNQYLVQVAELKTYADYRNVELIEI